MSVRLQTRLKRGALLSAALLMSLSMIWGTATVSATTTNSIYSYDLDGSSSTVTNGAASNSGVNLTLEGDWSDTSFGTHFTGNTVDEMSVGYGRPGGGSDTINVPSTSSVGVTARFKFEGPPLGDLCFPDSHNITQIGRFGEDLSQVKIQTSNCYDADWAVFPECRFAGADSTTLDLPFPSSQQLVTGQTYIVRCYKTPDPVTGFPIATIDVTQENTFYGNRTASDSFEITPTGTIQSTAYLSIANKYQLPSQENNTDQFIGDVSKVAFCQATTTAAVKTCLETENPDPVVPTPTREWVINPGVETNLDQWMGDYGGNANVQLGRSTDQAHSGSYSFKVLGLTGASNHKSGFSDDQPKLVTNATAGEVYNGSVWVKPDVVGEKINFRLREWDGSTLLTDNKVQLNPATTGWQQMTNSITATQNGSRLSFSVYGEDIDAGDHFYADDMSLVSTLADHEWAVNNSLEADLTGWDNLFSSSPYVTVAHSTADAHTGTGSLKLTAITGASNLTSGFGTTSWRANELVETGKTYRGSVWVKPSFTGQQIVLRLREYKWNGSFSDLYGEVKTVHVATSTNWQKIEGALTAATSESGISMIVHGKALNAGDYFYADDLSVTSLE